MTLLIDHRYRVLRQLGQGSTMDVYLVEDLSRDGRRLALKMLRQRADVAFLQNEFGVLYGLRHPNLARTVDMSITETQAYITCEFVDGPNVKLWSGSRPIPERLHALGGVLRGLCLLHDRGWVHGDLKPANILVARVTDEPELVDLGFAATPGLGRGGTPGYAAPEMMSGGHGSFRADVYSFAVLALEVLTGRRAFSPDGRAAVAQQMLGQSILEEPLALDPPWVAFLRRCMDLDPEARPCSALEALPALEAATGVQLAGFVAARGIVPGAPRGA